MHRISSHRMQSQYQFVSAVASKWLSTPRSRVPATWLFSKLVVLSTIGPFQRNPISGVYPLREVGRSDFVCSTQTNELVINNLGIGTL